MQHFTKFYDAYMFLKYNPMVWITDKNVFNYFNECLNVELIKNDSKNEENDCYFEMTLSSVNWNSEKKLVEIIPSLDTPVIGSTYEDTIIKLANKIYHKQEGRKGWFFSTPIFMKNFKKISIAITGLVCAVALFTVGSFSFMSSSSKEKIDSGTIGTLKATSALKIKTTDNSQSGKTLTNLNPGDIFDIELNVSNTGNKSLSTRSSLYLVWNPDDFNKYSNHEQSLLMYNSDISDNKIKEDMLNGLGSQELNLKTSEIKEFSFKNASVKGYKIDLPEVKLNGVGNNAEIDVLANDYPTEFSSNETFTNGTYSYKIAFSNYANVHTMDKDFKIIAVTEGLQNRNTNSSDWSVINIEEISI